jgi:hypothetical protein
MLGILSGYDVWHSAPSEQALGEFLQEVHANKQQVGWKR